MRKYSKNTKETEFLSANSANPGKMHVSMLQNRMANILRIGIANEKPSQKAQPAIKIEPPIIVQKIHFSEIQKQLEQKKELTNKLLTYSWDELSEKEKAYFKNNQPVFEGKKQLLFANSKIESELKSLHAQLHIAANDGERQQIAEKLTSFKKEQTDNWKVIDNFDVVEIAKEEPKSESMEKFELIQKRNNLRSQKTKLAKKIQDKENPKYNEWLENYNEVVKSLEEVENLINK